MNKKQLLILFLTILLTCPSNGQDWSRKGMLYLVPEAGLWFGRYTNLEFAPQLAYHITDRWSVGAGPHYIYYESFASSYSLYYRTNIWGVKAFSRYSIVKNAAEFLPIYLFDEFFAHLEFERLSLENRYFNAPTYPDEGRFWANDLYLGGGIAQRLGEFSSYSIMLLWNIDRTSNSYNSNPVYRVGFNIFFMDQFCRHIHT